MTEKIEEKTKLRKYDNALLVILFDLFIIYMIKRIAKSYTKNEAEKNYHMKT